MDERFDDLRSLPDTTLQLFLSGMGVWGVALLVLYVGQHTAWAIPLTFAVFVWQAVLTGWWSMDVSRRFDLGELTSGESRAGVRSVCRILAASSLLPAIVFLTERPLEASSWTAAFGVAVVAGAVWVITSLMARVQHRLVHGVALAVANLALPVNATGTITFGVTSGFFEAVML